MPGKIEEVEGLRDQRTAKVQCSFSTDTLILTDEGFKPISQIKIDDKVLAYDEETKTTGYFPVEQVWKHNDPIIEYLTIDGETITTTPEHPFFTYERGWVAAGDLWHGAHIRKADGSYGTVDSFSFVARWQAMYNLTVSDAHTFFVGEEEWLVHNECPPTGKRPKWRKGYSKQDFLDQQGDICVYCGTRLDITTVTREHIDAWKRIKQVARTRKEEIDLFHDWYNLTVACQACQSAKRAQLLLIFLRDNYR